MVNFKNRQFQTCINTSRKCISIFIKIGLVKISQNRAHKAICKNRKLHNYATYYSNIKTKLLSNMHHRITYLHINFQQNRVSRSVKTVHTNLFAKNCKLMLQLEFRKIKPFGHALPPHGHSGRF